MSAGVLTVRDAGGSCPRIASWKPDDRLSGTIEALEGRVSIGPDRKASGELRFLFLAAQPERTARFEFEWNGGADAVGKVTRVGAATELLWDRIPLRAAIAPDGDDLRVELRVHR
jgi:hypothetical protein